MVAPKQPVAAGPARVEWDAWLLVILVVALVLRASLLPGGGPAFWGDESRYDVSVSTAGFLKEGQVNEAADLILSKADHMGFKVAMIPLAWMQKQWGWSNGVIALIGSGFFSVGNILLVYGLTRRAGGSRIEGRWAALLMASAASMFYWSRHLVPYDQALFWGLLCFYVGLHPVTTWSRSLIAGFLGFLSFVTYNGAWMLVAFVLVAHVLLAWPNWRALLLRGSFGVAGLLGSFVLLALLAHSFGLNLLEAYLQFSGTITQGDFKDGFFVLHDYLWQADGGLVIVWLACACLLVWFGVRRESGNGRAWLWLLGLAGLAIGFVVLSNGLHKFVVYGRLARMLVPFACLLGGWGVARMVGARPLANTLAAGAIIALGALNLRAPLTAEFPVPFYRRGIAYIDEQVKKLPTFDEKTAARQRYKFLYLGFIWPEPEVYQLPPHEVIMQTKNPLQYEPYLYEGFNREQREKIHRTNITTRLVFIKD